MFFPLIITFQALILCAQNGEVSADFSESVPPIINLKLEISERFSDMSGTEWNWGYCTHFYHKIKSCRPFILIVYIT